MAHVLAPKPPLAVAPLFFNVDASVGNQGSNSRSDDIILVQFLLKLTGKLAVKPDARAKMLATPQTGQIDPTTIENIKFFQQSLRDVGRPVTVDGRISSAKGYHFGATPFTIVHLNAIVRAGFLQQWPRLQDIAECPAMLSPVIATIL